MGEDNNTFGKIFKRASSGKAETTIPIVIVNCMINIWYKCITNIYIILYNYFGALIVLWVQEIGYYRQLYILQKDHNLFPGN